ncbi:hypothetical protein TrCOL_g6054 [Triparma columacea]|uniref:BTB domain-containing protein n=1 Tax=Triparma columacea TaxID=722753 RepID=A0A9W7GEK3_9STRA|nr:hypothetical protein TrCOL_g6054 [Triparma columacea]
MFGGYSGTIRVSDLHIYSFAHETWTEVTRQSPTAPWPGARENNGVLTCEGSKVYVFGGYNGSRWLNDLWCFDSKTMGWTCLDEGDGGGGGGGDGVGEGAGMEQDGGEDDMRDGPSVRTPQVMGSGRQGNNNPKPSCRFGYVSAVIDGGYWLLGGYDGDRWLNDFWRYDLSSSGGSWVQITGVSEKDGSPPPCLLGSGYDIDTRECPSIRSCPCWCVVDFHPLQPIKAGGGPGEGGAEEKCILIMGGYDGVNRMNDFYVYGFRSQAWSLMPCRSRQRPSPRYFHSCVHVPGVGGGRGKVWLLSGYDGNTRLRDVWVYDLELYTWTEVIVTLPGGEDSRSAGGGGVRSSRDFGGGRRRRVDDEEGGGEGGMDEGWEEEGGAGGGEEGRGGEGDYAQPCGRSSLIAEYYRGYIFMFGGYNGNIVLSDFYRLPVASGSDEFQVVRGDYRTLMEDGIKDPMDMEGSGDVIFKVGPSGRMVRANRGILKARSSYFRQMFNSGMIESSSGTPHNPVAIADVNYNVFLVILEYLYTGTVKEGVGGDCVVEVLIVSERYMLDGLKVICEDAIRRGIDVESVSGLLITSARHNALVLKKISLDFVLENFERVKMSEGFKELVKEPELLMEILMKTTSGGMGGMMMGGVGGGEGEGRRAFI